MRTNARRARRWPAVAGWAIIVLAAAPAGVLAADRTKPNIVVILADDLGHADLGFQGCRDIPTPHIDSLARGGVRCREGYVSGPYCSPTRAGLLTGRYQQRFGHEFNPGGGAAGLPLGETTLADRLKAAGYATGLVGKWHLGEQPRFRPLRRGFDEFFGFLGGAHPYVPGKGAPIYRGDKVVEEKEYLTDAFAREAVSFIERHKAGPFFLDLAFNAVHTPMDATDERLSRFAAIGDTSRRTYAAMLVAMDEAVGRVLEALRAAGLEEDTLIFFLSDNGGPTMLGTTINASRNDPFRGSKRTTLEGGIHVPFVVQWKGKLPAGRVYDRPVIQLDILPTAMAAAGVAAPPEWHLDGVDLLPHLRGEATAPPHDALFWRMGGQMAVRRGDWKLVRYDEAADHSDVRSAAARVKVTPPRLYNLADDPGERHDLAAGRPEVLRELSDIWKSWDAQLARPLWGPGSRASAAGRRNVLFIAVDDLNDWVGCLGGHPQAVTPNIDRLARRGTLFTNAHCQAPVCNPSRASLLTGLRPSTTGIYALEPGIRAVASTKDRVTLPQHFAANGYATAHFGKVFHDGSIPLAGRAREFDVWGEAGRTPLPKEKLVHTPDDIPAMDWGIHPDRDEDCADWKIADAAIAHLKGLSEDRPFFLAVGFRLPHVPCFAPKKWFDLIPEGSLMMPAVKDDDRDDVPTFAWFLHWKLPEPRLSWLRQADQWRPLVRAYLASTSFMDSQVGRVLDALDASGRADDTVVVLWSDHGWHLGEKGITGKNSLWERSTRVPLIFAGPGVAAGSICARPAELLDLYPTLVRLCGLPARDDLEGHSLVPQLKDPDAPRPWPAITTHNRGNHSVRSERWHYIRYADGGEELYDRRDDPHEWTNLAHDPGLAEVKRDHARWLPAKEASPAPGSVSRLLDQEDGIWYWENRPIVPGEAGRRLPQKADDRQVPARGARQAQ